MKWTIIGAIILAIVLAGMTHHAATPPAPPATPTATSHAPSSGVAAIGNQAVRSSDADGTVSATCAADGTPTDVHPNTATGRAKARELCASANAQAQAVASKLNAEGQ
jgi:hypothetical protein